MKIDRRGFLVASSSALVLAKAQAQLSSAASVQPAEISEPLSIEGREVAVYTTADNYKPFRNSFIRPALATGGGKLTPFGSPWSPPAFMKDNNNMLHGGKLKLEFYQSWANYYTKFIKAYQREGIPIWGITIQNEPMATQTWESCIYTGEEERDFLKNFLGPTMNRGGLGDKKILGWDHNRDLIYQRASTLLKDPEAAKYLW